MKEKETKSRTYNRKKLTLVFCVCVLMLVGLVARLVRLMVYEADYYQELAEDLHQRERSIKAAGEGFSTGMVRYWLPTVPCVPCRWYIAS